MFYVKFLLFMLLLMQVRLYSMEDLSNTKVDKMKITYLTKVDKMKIAYLIDENKPNNTVKAIVPFSQNSPNFNAEDQPHKPPYELSDDFYKLIEVAVVLQNEKDYLNFSDDHIELQKKEKEKKHKCEVCNKFFLRPAHLRCHELIHTGEKPFSCSDCSYACIQKSTLKAHMRTHTGEKPYTCPKCEKKFSLSSSCKRHQKEVCRHVH